MVGWCDYELHWHNMHYWVLQININAKLFLNSRASKLEDCYYARKWTFLVQGIFLFVFLTQRLPVIRINKQKLLAPPHIKFYKEHVYIAT